MHGNTPYAGRPGVESSSASPDQRRSLRRQVTALAADVRTLLPDEFVVGSEIVEGSGGPRATIAVQPPAGGVVSAGFGLDDDADRVDIARQLAAGAALEVKRAAGDAPQVAR